MEYQSILNKIKLDIQQESFCTYLEEILDKMVANGSLSQNMDNIYGFYVSYEERASVIIYNSGSLEFHCEHKFENNVLRRSVLFQRLENGFISLQYSNDIIHDANQGQESIFETMIFNDEHKLVHVRYEKNGESITIPTSDLSDYRSVFYQEKFQNKNKSI